jgi:hypothetical protein
MRRLIAVCVLLLACTSGAKATPPQLLNKTITSSYTVATPAIEDDGRRIVASRTAQRRIYISTAGRIFEKRVQFGRKSRKEAELDPSNTRLHFSGAKLRAFVPRVEGVTLIEYTFDPSFRTCDVAVVNGRGEGRARKWRALSGRMRTATGPTTMSNVSCSITDGNAL